MDKEKIERYATIVRSPYIECSALTGENINEIFNLLIREIRKQ